MTPAMALVVLALGLALTLAGDTPQPMPATAATPAPAPIDPLFDCYSVNYAWGFSLAGTVVDRDGTIYRYRNRDKDRSPPVSASSGPTWLAAAALRAKFEHRERIGSVDAQSLAANSALVAKAADGTVTRADTGTRDAGTSTCHAYIANGGSDRYRDVQLGSDAGISDVRVSNAAPEAQALLAWLKSVGVAQ